MTEMLPSTGRRGRTRSASWVLATAVLIATAGCGSQVSDGDFVEALQGPTISSVSTAGTAVTAAAAEQTGGGAGPALGSSVSSVSVTPRSESTLAGGDGAPAKVKGGAMPTTAAAAAAPTVANKSVVKIGQLGVFSGAIGALTVDSPRTLAAWAADVNSRGGLNGHPVRIILGDDGGDPGTSLTLARRMVESDKVIAMVATVVIFGFSQVEKYLREKNIPIVGTETADPLEYGSPITFPTGAPASVQIVTSLKHAISEGASKIGFVYCLEVTALCTYFKEEAVKDPVVGKHIVESYQVSIVAPSYTSQCIRMQQSGVDYVFLAMDTAGSARLIQDCKRQGFEPRTGLLGLDATRELPTIAALANTAIPGATISPGATGLPSVDTYRAVMRQFAASAGISGMGTITWSAAKLFELVTKNLSETPTSAEIFQGLWKVKGETLGGFTVPLTYIKGQPPTITKCVFIWGVANQQYVAPQGNKPVC